MTQVECICGAILGLPDVTTDGEQITCNACRQTVIIRGENYRFIEGAR